MYKIRATWNCDFTGQKYNYADTTTEGNFVVESVSEVNPDWTPFNVTDEQAKRMLRGIVGWTDNPTADPFAPVLRTFEKVGEGKWYVFIVSRYND